MADQQVNSLVTGLASSLNQYMGLNIQNQMQQQNAAANSNRQLQNKMVESAYQSGLDVNKNQQTEKYKVGLEDVLTPDMAEKALPGYGAQMVNDYNKQRPDSPLKLKEGVGFLKTAMDHLDAKKLTQDKSDDVRLAQYATNLRADKEFSLVRVKRDNLENVKGLLDQVSNQADGPDRRQMYEQSVAQMRVLAQNGQLSEREIEHLLPSTFRGKIAQGLEWLTNHPQSTEAQDFLKRSQDFFTRESKITNDQLSRRLNELSAPYKTILERRPDTASEVFTQYNVSHPKYNPKSNNGKSGDPLGLGI